MVVCDFIRVIVVLLGRGHKKGKPKLARQPPELVYDNAPLIKRTEYSSSDCASFHYIFAAIGA